LDSGFDKTNMARLIVKADYQNVKEVMDFRRTQNTLFDYLKIGAPSK